MMIRNVKKVTRLVIFLVFCGVICVVFAQKVHVHAFGRLNLFNVAVTDSGTEQSEKVYFVRNIEKVYSLIQSDSYKLGFTDEEIAMRLYYLRFIAGEATEKVDDDEELGQKHDEYVVDFSLNAPLTRLEALVIAVRLMGKEEEALTMNYPHEFSDVPQWGAPYVGYACYARFPGFSELEISKMRSVEISDGSYLTDEYYFYPDNPISSNMFIDYLQYILGYSDPSEAANQLSLFKYVKKRSISRSEAFEYVFRTLRSDMNNDNISLAEMLVDSEIISYEDAIFLIWSDDAEETDEYIKNVGYSPEETIPNGYYMIVNENGKYLNVNSTGANSDYEGIGVTLFSGTGDITQAFRFERTERGTYLIYSAASRGGFSRLLGINSRVNATCTALYAPTSNYAKEFYIKRSYSENSDEKKWYLIPYESYASAECNVLSASDTSMGLNLSQISVESFGNNQLWSFESADMFADAATESAIFPAVYLHITQGPYGDYSHMEQNAIDCVSVGRFFAPFTAEIKRIDTEAGGGANIVIIESTSMVKFADGTKDYMTVAFLHDDDISDLHVGQLLIQGQGFYDMGTAGNATGDHVHIACYRGKYNPLICTMGSGNLDAQDAFFIISDTRVKDSGGIKWVYKK